MENGKFHILKIDMDSSYCRQWRGHYSRNMFYANVMFPNQQFTIMFLDLGQKTKSFICIWVLLIYITS